MKRQTDGLLGTVLAVGASAALLFAGAAAAAPPDHSRAGGVPGCEEELNECDTDLGTCEDDLLACEEAQVVFPGDGVSGAPLAYQECTDGLTVADLNTGLLWERKVAGGSFACDLAELHLVDSACNWAQATGDWIDA